MRAIFFLLILFLVASCVTGARQHDCFEFGSWQCVNFYRNLSSADQATSTGVALIKQICEHSEIKCVEEAGDHGFPLNLKMAKKDYANLSQKIEKGVVTGMYHKAGDDPRHKDSIAVLLGLEQQIQKCEAQELSACEKLITKGNFGSGFDTFFRKVPEAVIEAASSRVCKSKEYKCISFDHTRPYEAPKGWAIVENNTSFSFKENVKTEKRNVILKKR